MSTGELAAFTLGLAAAVVAVVLVQRSARVLARWRHRGQASARFARIAWEVNDELEPVIRRVEAVRLDEVAPGEIITLVSDTMDSLARAGREVRELAFPPPAVADREAFLVQLMHASRALEAILDACLELEGSTQAERRERAPYLLKWGHLNLVRAYDRLGGADHQVGGAAAPSLTGPGAPS